MSFRIATPQGIKNITLKNEDQILSIAKTLKEAGYTRDIGRMVRKAINPEPCEE